LELEAKRLASTIATIALETHVRIDSIFLDERNSCVTHNQRPENNKSKKSIFIEHLKDVKII
jgi:hypothetical protein